MFKIYKDLLNEIQSYKEEIEALTIREDRLLEILNKGKPREIKGQAYNSEIRGCSDDTTLDRTLGRLDIVRQLIIEYTELLELTIADRDKMNLDFKKSEGLYYKVYDLNRIQKIPLESIAEILGYSYDYIKKISAELSKNAS